MGEMRHDPLSGRTVIVAPGRSTRPHGFRRPEAGGDRDADGSRSSCPFCPDHEAMTPPEVARRGPGPTDGPGWRVRVVPNLYPFTDAHEVVVLSPDHYRSFGALSAAAAADALAVMRDRTRHHLDRGHGYVQALVNHGREAGASLPHPHGQIVGVDSVPPAVEALAARFAAAGTDLVARQWQAAAADGFGVVDGPAAAWCPPASAAPYQMAVAHRAAGPRFDEAGDGEIAETAAVLGDTLARLAVVADDPPYNLIVHTAPPSRPAGPFHWYLEIVPRLSVVAAFEQGTGIFVNTVAPEDAAAALRRATPTPRRGARPDLSGR